MRAEFKIPHSQPLQTVVELSASSAALVEEAQAIKSLARTEPLLFQEEGSPRPPADKTVSVVLSGATVLVPLEGLVDTARERSRLEQELQECLENLQRLSQRLSNTEFTGKAPVEVVERERGRLEGLEERRDRIQELLSQLG